MKPLIVSIGELLWDMLPAGRQIGGAPGNFAWHVHALGLECALISSVGDDADGREIVERLRAVSLPTGYIGFDHKHPTGKSTVDLDNAGIPVFNVHENVAWDFIPYDTRLNDVARQASAVLFGTLGQRSEVSRKTIQKLVGQTSPSTLRIFDANLREPHYSREVIESSLKLASGLKINSEEFSILVEMFGLDGSEGISLGAVAERFDLRLIALTRGHAGSILYLDGQISGRPGYPCVVADTVGAGDAFAAALTVGILAGHDVERLNDNANRLAAFVCSKPGATPVLPCDLLDELCKH